ncbi:MAG: M81 family metallopeptidase [Xanthomonadales bacterium]|nr:M81 family metallopeptidase [Xanthomonadales bacterium]
MNGALFYASLSTETNSFSDIPVTYADYTVDMRRGDDVVHDSAGKVRPGAELLLEFAADRSMELVTSLSASADPGAPTLDSAYARLRDEILEDLGSTPGVRAVFLGLHGAMMAQSCFDCEGDLLRRVREIVGPGIPIAAVLDPHAHLTDAMVTAADILVFMKEYPHTDGADRTREALAVTGELLDQELTLSSAVINCELLGFFPTNRSPMREFVDAMVQKETHPEVVSISFIHGFPWGDTPDVGSRVLVYTRDNPVLAQRLGESVRDEIWSIRDQTMFDTLTIEQALDRVDASGEGPRVFGDIADNPGGGAPGDSTFILAALVQRRLAKVVVGCLFDPDSVRQCHAAGVGSEVSLSVGGKLGEFSGQPVAATGVVKGLGRSVMMNVADAAEFPMGDTAWVQIDGIDLVLISTRTQTYAPHAFTHLGLELEDKAAIFVKSTNHFQAFFADLASEVGYVNTPGAIDFDLARIPYRHFNKPYYPRGEMP